MGTPPRSLTWIYLGHSPFHYGSVALVLNPETGHVSHQLHVVFYIYNSGKFDKFEVTLSYSKYKQVYKHVN